jgi:hypothetical protein
LAEWLGSGLQSRVQQFESARRLFVHGLIFTSFRQFCWSHYPAEADAIWAGLPRYLAVDSYPDGDFDALVERAVQETGDERREVLLSFGRYTAQTIFRLLKPEYYEASNGTVDFLLGVEERIHETVRATITGAAPPRLQVVRLGADGVSISYTSDRALCDLLEGLVQGTAEYYREQFEIAQPTCVRRGDAACCFFVTPAAG